jgi:hypothetical protein
VTYLNPKNITTTLLYQLPVHWVTVKWSKVQELQTRGMNRSNSCTTYFISEYMNTVCDYAMQYQKFISDATELIHSTLMRQERQCSLISKCISTGTMHIMCMYITIHLRHYALLMNIFKIWIFLHVCLWITLPKISINIHPLQLIAHRAPEYGHHFSLIMNMCDFNLWKT